MAIYHLMYRTNTAGRIPTAANMPLGRLAVNLTDERLFFKNTAGVIVEPQPRSHVHPVSEVTGLQTALDAKANSSITLTAGNGLTGGGNLTANRTVTLGTPGTLTGATTNAVQATSHTHQVSLSAGDVGAIPTSEKGSANGVATLDSTSRLPLNQAPSSILLPTTAHSLDDYRTNGDYRQNATAGAVAGGASYPVPYAGSLYVSAPVGISAANLLWQEYVVYGQELGSPSGFAGRRYWRSCANTTTGVWGPWREVPRKNEVMTHIVLSGTGVDLNAQFNVEAYYTWAAASVMANGINFPPAPTPALGTLQSFAASATWTIQKVTLALVSTRRPAVYYRVGNTGTSTWGPWKISGSLSATVDLPTADCGDVYVDGVGMHSWIGGAYINVSIPYIGFMAAAQDLNTYLYRGVWTVSTAATANGGSNFPIGQAGNLEVFAQVSTGGTPAGYVVQRYTSGNSSQTFVRSYANGIWTTWKEYADTASAMTQTTLSSAADANTLTTPNTRYIWTNGAVVNSGTNWPSLSGSVARGFLDVVAMSSSQIYQRFVCTLASNVHPIVFERYGSVGGTWYSWRVAGPWSPTSFSSYAPTADYGDLQVDGVGTYRWNTTLSKYALAPVTPTQREGLGTEWASATNILVKPGRCSSVSGDVLLELTANNTRTIQTSGAFTHSASGNGLLTGVRQAGWWYYVFLIRRDSDGSVCVAFDNNAQCINRPSGYSHYCRIGTVRTGSSNNLVAYTQVGNEFWYDEEVYIYINDQVISGTVYQPNIGMPGISTTVHMSGWLVAGANGALTMSYARLVRGGGYTAFYNTITAHPGSNSITHWSFPSIYVNAVAPNIRVQVSNPGTITLYIRGYTDHFED